jgi:hypothetical protein
MTTRLRCFYEELHYFSTATHQEMCNDFLRALRATRKPTLANWFMEAFQARTSFDNVCQPFLNEESLQIRKPIGPDARGDNRIIHLLSTKQAIQVTGLPNEYQFQYVERQVPPLRVEGSGQPTSGAGGIDFIGRRGVVPILGEVKLDTDQNPFYAFIQLLTYLSEMATPKQIERANRWSLFGGNIGRCPSFDLHIILADFNDRGEKGQLVEPTRQLALEFKRRLLADFPDIAGVLGNVLCLRLNSQDFSGTCSDLDARWVA